MKKYFFMAVALVMGAVCFTSCGDDDKDDLQKAAQAVVNGGGNGAVVVNGNVMSLTLSYAGVYTMTYTATFESADSTAALKSCILTETYASAALADIAEQEYKDDEIAYTRSGNTFTFDETEDFKRYNYSQMRTIFEAMKKEYEEDINDL